MSDDPSKRTPPPISSNRAPGRYDKVTVPEMTSIPTLLGEIQASVKDGFVRVNSHLDTLNHAFDGLQDRVQRLEDRDAKSRTGPQKTYSGPIQALTEVTSRISSSDTTQNLDIESLKASIIEVKQAQESAAIERTETAAKVTAVHDAVVEASNWVTRAWNAPTTKVVRKLVTAAIIFYAAARGIHIGN